MIYEIGDLARLKVTFTDLSGTLTDPTTVELTVQAPDDTQTPYTPINESTGKWYYDLDITQSGKYLYRWTGTGAVQAVKEGSITVAPTTLVPTTPTPTPPEFTQEMLNALDAAIASGANRVKFADREMQYNSMKDMLTARNLIKQYLDQQSATPARRQIRMITSTGF